MELLRFVRRRSFLSEVIYYGLNIAFAVAILVVIRTTESLLFAVALVALSKWRVLAVRQRYWLANVQANLVDLIVSLSMACSLYAVELTAMADSSKWIIEGLATLLFIVWLLVLKPRSTRRAMVAQAAIALFVGSSVLYSFSYDWPVSIVVILMWLIGYGTARHVLSTYDEDRMLFLSLVWGTALAEIGWAAYFWTVGYALPATSGLYVPQISILLLCVGFVTLRAYNSFFHYQKIRTQDMLLPVIFTACVAVVLLVFFDGLGTSI